ncbi:heme-binding protein [Roseiconus nitratireducens]|uniref:Heme-binding protein n=1 Tax=Roseiconus nitratireducens TaxID=2605748 RepID=A0A5M6D0T5_9BACT|nr:heme-binding protein [Roseiconus nitratireducens]KAA5539219.1 heme-binding protein [Roseiconus nitratireducens]
MNMRTICLVASVGMILVGLTAWTLAERTGYETAEYEVIEADGSFEIREYPDLTLAATNAKPDAEGRDGSFMRLFGYISGENQANQKIEMTTPVFMEPAGDPSAASMGFVMPKDVAESGAPDPSGTNVEIRTRKGGRFAVIRFSGQLDSKLAEEQETKLREWMQSRGLEGEATAETAGYDPPFKPAALRRNEVLIRLKARGEPSESEDQ